MIRYFCDRCKTEIYKPEYVGAGTFRRNPPGFHEVVPSDGSRLQPSS